MQRFDKVKEEIHKINQKLVAISKDFISDPGDLESYYISTHEGWNRYDDEGNVIYYTKKDFKDLYFEIKIYLNRQKNFIAKLMDINNDHKNGMTKHMYGLIYECINRIKNELLQYDEYRDLIYLASSMTDFSHEYKSILLLSDFSNVDNNIILIGGNGSGKTSLAKTLKGDDMEYISVVPAQKTLFFSVNSPELFSTRLDELKLAMLENNISKSKEQDDYNYFQYQNNQFTKLIIAMKEDYFNCLIESDNQGTIPNSSNCIFGNLKKVYKDLFPEIEMIISPSNSNDFLKCKKNGEVFHINSLSEGEKAVIYYTISVLMANEDSFIVVDEPETYLNPSLTNSLWNILIGIRKDCQFIFITHSVDFVLGRSEDTVYWIKEFIYPDNWKFEKIEDNFMLPQNLLTEVLGSKKEILFCEGDNKGSLDYHIYTSLFGEKYTVIPVGGHSNVINYSGVISKSDWHGMRGIGIIDGDNIDEIRIKVLEKKKVYVIPFNEIEMLLVCDEVLNATLQDIFYDETDNKIKKFKEKFWVKAEANKDKISMIKVKSYVEDILKSQGIERYKNIDEISDNIKTISEIPVKEIFKQIKESFMKVLENKDYEELLVNCNLKKEITRELANKYLDNDYENKAIKTIRFQKELKEILIKKYFEFIEME